jgi:hypothetical protein
MLSEWRQIDLICMTLNDHRMMRSASLLAYASDRSAFILTMESENLHPIGEGDGQIVLLACVPNSDTLVVFTSHSVLSAHNAQTSLLLNKFLIARGDCAFCASCINEQSNLFLIEQCSLRIMNFEAGRNVLFPLPENPTDIGAITATTDRIALVHFAAVIRCSLGTSPEQANHSSPEMRTALFASSLLWLTHATSPDPSISSENGRAPRFLGR